MSWILGIDTSSIELGIGIYKENTPVVSFSRYIRNSHAEHISHAIKLLISTSGAEPEQINTIAIAIGPGSFTGLRIGLSFVKGFSLGRDVKVLPVSSLEIMAQSLIKEDCTVITTIDARNNDVFWSKFSVKNGELFRETEDSLSTIEELRKTICPDDIIITDTQGYAKSTVFNFLEKRGKVYPAEKFPLQRGLMCAAIGSKNMGQSNKWSTPIELLPNYLRPSAAQIKAGL